MTAAAPATSRFAPLGWAAFLGVSWTWCIGMYLPILMVRDLGLAGYLVFAIPNVVGAAAMGWVLRSPASSLALTTRHAGACRSFSIVTNGYHAFWASWLLAYAAMQMDVPGWAWSLLLAAGLWAGIARLLVAKDASARVAALLVLTFSLVAMLIWLSRTGDVSPTLAETLDARPFSADAMWMLPVSTLGFLLCPYLDLTFNRARQACETPAQSRIAFGVGFGVCFALMIAFTLLYAGPLVGIVDEDQTAGMTVPLLLGGALGVHVAMQLGFTVMAHGREVDRSGDATKHWHSVVVWSAIGFGIALAGLAEQRWFGMAPGEFGYRVFLSFYGLVFPAYVWINVVDVRRRAMRDATPRSLAVTLAAMALAAPFYFVGFMLRDEPWLVPGVAIILLAKLAAGPDRQANHGPPA
ncbi:MAG: hypothetical protein AAFS11_03345 [Planctomycetota bacterium]